MTRFLRSLLLAVGLVSPWAWAQATPPEQVASEYLRAVQHDGLEVAPKFIHPQELVRFQNMVLPLFQIEGAGKGLARMFFGKPYSAGELARMDPAAFMSAYLGVVGKEFRGAHLMLGEPQIIGSVREGQNVHVLVRVTVGNADFKMTRISVISMMPVGDTWKLLLTGEIEGLGQAIQQRVEGARR